MQTTKPRPPRAAPTPPRRSRGRLYLAATAAALVLLFLGGLAGWMVHGGSGTHHDVTVLNTFTGKITILNTEGTAGCVKGGGHKACSQFVRFGTEPLHVGQTVRVAHELYKNSAGDGYDWLLVVPDRSPL